MEIVAGILADVLTDYWYLWVLVLLIALYRLFLPVIKGWFGEKTVSLYLRALPKEEYTVLPDLILKTENGTTQIDHVVVSRYGVFVIEVKNYKGWILGGEHSAQWTQNLYGKKNRFMNPIHQNHAHVKALEARLTSYPQLPILPIVAFSPGCELKVKTTSPVVHFHRLARTIRQHREPVLQADETAAVVKLLQADNIRSAEVRKEHVQRINDKKKAIETAAAGSKCPQCDGTLMERSGRNGRFIGCSNFPKCRFTKPL